MVGRLDFDFSAPVAVLREPLACALTPVQAVAHLREDERPFALLGAWAGGGAILGSDPVAVLASGDDAFSALDLQPRVAADTGVVGGGWFGYLGFGLARGVERLDPPPPVATSLPPGALGFYDHVVRQDVDGRWWFEALVTRRREAAIAARRSVFEARLVRPAPARPYTTEGWRWSPGPSAHAALVDACRERIAAGDLFQANLATRLEGQIDGDPIDLFVAATSALPTDRAAFLAGRWGALASLSPELFLERHGRDVRCAPIKGTRPAARAAELRASAKDRAENVMIVDLMRNDLGRVCIPGTIDVPELGEVRIHAGVAHLVSQVTGRLRDAVSDADLLRATFPPGSVTGAPKIAALNVISELESTRREAYTGAIGFASPLAGLELSVAIRTFEARGRQVWLGAGGGIVADSDGHEEAAEAAAKARPLLTAIRARLPGSASTPAPRWIRHGPRPVPRPDPAAGIYDTVRVINGIPQRWAAHRARLEASLRVLYQAAVPPDLDARVAESAQGSADARLRIDIVPGVAPHLRVTANPARADPVLRPVLVPGGIGAHKWRDRTLLEAHERDDPDTLPLLIDADGLVLETSRTAIVVEARDGTLWTPPADGRILPSTTVAAHTARCRTLTLDDLHAATAIYVASALRELQRATLTG